MAVLSAADRDAIWAELMRTLPPPQTFPFTKGVFRDVIDAVDQVLSDYGPTLNTAIRDLNPAWLQLSVSARAFVFSEMVMKRYFSGVN